MPALDLKERAEGRTAAELCLSAPLNELILCFAVQECIISAARGHMEESIIFRTGTGLSTLFCLVMQIDRMYDRLCYLNTDAKTDSHAQTIQKISLEPNSRHAGCMGNHEGN